MRAWAGNAGQKRRAFTPFWLRISGRKMNGPKAPGSITKQKRSLPLRGPVETPIHARFYFFKALKAFLNKELRGRTELQGQRRLGTRGHTYSQTRLIDPCDRRDTPGFGQLKGSETDLWAAATNQPYPAPKRSDHTRTGDGPVGENTSRLSFTRL